MKNSASTWISTVFLLLCSNGVEAEVPDRITPPQLLPGTKKIYRVELSINLIEGDTLIPKLENDLNWAYWNEIQTETGTFPWGYSDYSRSFRFAIESTTNIKYSFNVAFEANEFKKFPDAPSRMDNALLPQNLNNGLAFNLGDQFMNTAIVTAETDDTCNWVDATTGFTVCGSFNLQCIEDADRSGNVECVSVCDAGYRATNDLCGANGACSQTRVGNGSQYSDHQCSCADDSWWIKGGEYGTGLDPCKPVLMNWLIIVIAVIAFLLLILIIIAIVYCCIHGCVCPCKCAKCGQGDDESGIYQIKGNTNPSFLGDTASSKAPLYSHYPLPDDRKMVENPAVWNDPNDFALMQNGASRNGTFRTEADAYDADTVPRVHEKRSHRSYASHDPRKHRSNRNESGTEKRRKRSDNHKRPDKSSHSPSKKQLNTLEAEIQKLESDIQNMKTDLSDPKIEPANSSFASTVQAPLPQSNTAIGEVIAELKAHNQARTIERGVKHKEDALELSDEEVDQPLRKYESRTVLVETPTQERGQRTLNDTLKDRWRVPQLTVLPVDDNPIRQIDSSVI